MSRRWRGGGGEGGLGTNRCVHGLDLSVHCLCHLEVLLDGGGAMFYWLCGYRVGVLKLQERLRGPYEAERFGVEKLRMSSNLKVFSPALSSSSADRQAKRYSSVSGEMVVALDRRVVWDLSAVCVSGWRRMGLNRSLQLCLSGICMGENPHTKGEHGPA